MERILCIVNSLDAGGAETFLMKVYRTIDKTKIQMDFYVMSQSQGYYEEEISNFGGIIYHSIPKSKNPIKSFLDLKRLVNIKEYNYVMRISQHSLATIDLIAAKLGGAEVLIQRSSNANSENLRSKILHKIFKILPKTVPTIKLAPSTEAADYTFGKNSVINGRTRIIKNAIPISNFLFNSQKRIMTRQELGINNKFVVGHIGRFSDQKNHSFLIDVFAEIVKKNNESVLLLVGKGELESEIKEKIEVLGLCNKVIFTGVRSDISEILMSMDVFVFPSFFEGMPNTVIEAQATGLPCIISDTITKEVDITGFVKFKSLQEPSSWAELVLNASNLERGYEKQKIFIEQKFKDSGYDINTEAKILLEEIIR